MDGFAEQLIGLFLDDCLEEIVLGVAFGGVSFVALAFPFGMAKEVEGLVAGVDVEEVLGGLRVVEVVSVFPQFDDDVLGYVLGIVWRFDKLQGYRIDGRIVFAYKPFKLLFVCHAVVMLVLKIAAR